MRLFFIPGFGEDKSVFDKINGHFPQEKIFPDHWELIGNHKRPDLDVLGYARELIEHFGIAKEDVVIGHSMGGWIALHIKHIVGCRIVQVASWTDRNKVVAPKVNPGLIYWFVRSGLYFNSFMMNYFLRKYYHNKPSTEIYISTYKRLIKGNKENVINQLRLIFNPVNEALSVEPDLRIHSRADTTILFPDESFHEVPGDHFNLWTHPEAIYPVIHNFLANSDG